MQIEDKVTGPAILTNLHQIIDIRFLTERTFVLRFGRGNLKFRAGQHIIVGLKGELNQREYSVYSGEKDDYLEILVREVLDGSVSLQLKNCKPGDLLQVNGPFGSFGIEPFDMSKKLVFISTGTGISPFHSFVRSYPGTDYTLIHGVRYSSEAYERNDFDQRRYILCTSKENNPGGHKGRVTRILTGYKVTPDMLFYLCGNNNMIYEAYHILRDKGIPDEKIFTEVYF